MISEDNIFFNKGINMSLDDYIAEKLPRENQNLAIKSEACIDLSLDDYISQTRPVKSENQEGSLNMPYTKKPFKRWRKRANKKNRELINTNSTITRGLYTKSALDRQQSLICYKDPNESDLRGSSVNDLSIEFENANFSEMQKLRKNKRNQAGMTRKNGFPVGMKHRLNYNHVNGNNSSPQIMPRNTAICHYDTSKLANSSTPNNGESFIKMCQDMLPTLASKLFPVEEKPIKYDIQLQQEICDIQGKPFMYKCGGTDVVTCDGAGINVDVQPHTTNRTLNQRFA